MRAVIQRVNKANVLIEGKTHAQINNGLLIFIGIAENDTENDVHFIVKKTLNLRIFDDNAGKPNLSVLDVKGEILLVSQFTLLADSKKGNRPSFINAAKPEKAIPLYQDLISNFNLNVPKPIKTGVFGADMTINLSNNGPFTIWLDSKEN